MTNETKHKLNLENWERIGKSLSKEECEIIGRVYYSGSLHRYKCKHCGAIKIIQQNNFKTRLTKCECVKQKEIAEHPTWSQNLATWELVKTIPRKENHLYNKSEYGTYGIYKCKHCEEERIIHKSEIKSSRVVCNNGCNATRDSKKVIKGVNDIATVAPEMVNYLVNKEEAFKYKSRSSKKLRMKCIYCGEERMIAPGNFMARGFCCSTCSDGVSYPERVIGNILKQFDIEYEKQMTLDNRKTKYDFYLPKFNTIIETHGKQHYVEVGFSKNNKRTLEAQQESDEYKMGLALSKGYNYIVLDCRYSNIEWIRDSFLKSSLSSIVNVDMIDWDVIDKHSSSSLFQEVVDYYKETQLDTKQLAKVFNLDDTTISGYLRKAHKLGLCNYKPKTGKRKVVFILNGEIKAIYQSTLEASKELDYCCSTIGNLARGFGSNKDCDDKHDVVSSKLGGCGAFYYLDHPHWERDKHMFATEEVA